MHLAADGGVKACACHVDAHVFLAVIIGDTDQINGGERAVHHVPHRTEAADRQREGTDKIVSRAGGDHTQGYVGVVCGVNTLDHLVERAVASAGVNPHVPL